MLLCIVQSCTMEDVMTVALWEGKALQIKQFLQEFILWFSFIIWVQTQFSLVQSQTLQKLHVHV